MSERPHHIPIPPATGLKSALKHSSPSTPQPASSPPGSNTSDGGPLGHTLTHRTSLSSTLSPHLQDSSPEIGYLPKVSFDTFENPAAPIFSFTLQAKSEGYKRNRSTRVFLCASSPDESGTQALDWVMDSLIQDGDELVVLRGFDTEVLATKDQEPIRDEARELMRLVQKLNTDYDPDRKLSIIIEFIAGKVTEAIDRLIALYRPDSLVVGSRGQRGVKAWSAALGGAVGSVSRYCLSHSPVPVIVVRPERKVRKTMEKRRADPKRGIHFEELKSPTLSAVKSAAQ